MAKFFEQWLQRKWQPVTQQSISQIDQDVHAIFNTASGQRVMQHLLDNVYCQCCPLPADAVTLATHNGRRSVVHEILEMFDRAANRQKYEAPQAEPMGDVRRVQ